MRCGKWRSVNWRQDFIIIHQLKMRTAFGARRKFRNINLAEVVACDPYHAQTATIRQRNVINEGDLVEFYGPGFQAFLMQ